MRYTPAAMTGSLIFLVFCAAGCPQENQGPSLLNRANTALEDHDYATAARAADEQLAAPDNSSHSRFQAYFLKGRAVEARPKSSVAQVTTDLAEARSDYEKALAENPTEPDLSQVRSALANVAFFQDDYLTAKGNWGAVSASAMDTDSRAWVLYRVGLCQQRLGRFDEADRTFQRVQRSYPDTEQAKRAEEHIGVRSFAVQVATMSQKSTADKLVDMLAKQGLKAAVTPDSKGRFVVSIPNLNSYSLAKQVRTQVAADYPDAMINP
jgi:tetratricopeptide (TPR) repeat protein